MAKRSIPNGWLLLAICAGAVFSAISPLGAAQPVSLESLLGEMIDRQRPARFPQPAFVCRQFSSFDRDTKSPQAPGWFANWDRSQFVRVEENAGRREYVMMDAPGPGAVVRFWGTWHGPGGGPFSNGTLRVYLDGSPQPAIQGPIADLISGGALIGPPLSDSVSPQTEYARRGHNLYLPIPYQTHCKITYQSDKIVDFGAKKGEAIYYQINYRTYTPGTSVETFRRGRLEQLKPLVEKVGRRLVQSGWGEEQAPASPPVRLAGDLPPQASSHDGGRSILLKGPAAIRQLTLRLKAGDPQQALRSTVLEITFDGDRAVWCPVGDFFGIGYHLHKYRSWYTEVDEDGTMRCFWVMPFEKSCQVRLLNPGQQPVEVELAALAGNWSWDDRSMHFHAAWHQYTKIDTGPNKDQTGRGAFDVNYVKIDGRGQYVGDTLTVFNGTNAWWGEGDEKIYIDGETFPSHIGTGTEDYYGYAWCRAEPFQSPFHAQPTGEGNMAGGFSVDSRYRILDSLPFQHSIRFDMELWHWRHTRMNYAPTTFWYARPGATCNVQPDPKTAALPVAKKRGDVVEIFHAPGAIEGESLKIVEKTGGTTQVQEADAFRWSNDRQLWWRDAHPGDRLVLELPVPQAGRYRVTANLTKARDYAVVQLSLGGRPAGEPLDRFAPQVGHNPLALGQFSLDKGPNRLTVEITGANPKAVKSYMFGLDYVKLEKVE